MLKITFEFFSGGKSFGTDFSKALEQEIKNEVESKLKHIDGIENEYLKIEYDIESGQLNFNNVSSKKMEIKIQEALS